MIARLLVGGRLVLGALLLAAPEEVLGRLSQRPVGEGERAVARLLGVRNLVEGAFVARHPRPGWFVAGAAVDATHSLSMVVLAVVSSRHRRLARASALAAATTAAAGFVAARRTPPRLAGREG